MRKRLWFVLLPLLMGAKSSVPIELPETIHLAQFTDTIKTSKVLIEALANKKWFVEADTGESITARLDVKSHRLRLRIDYTPRDISFHYVDSQELGYFEEQGAIYIHPNANKWLGRLETEVRIQVQRLNFDREPAEVVPVEPAPGSETPPPAPEPAAPLVPKPQP